MKMTLNELEKLMTVHQAATIKRCTTQTVRNHIAQGSINHVQISTRWFVVNDEKFAAWEPQARGGK